MAKSKKIKRTKQESFDEEVTFGGQPVSSNIRLDNIKNATAEFNAPIEEIPKSEEDNNSKSFTFTLHRDVLHSYHSLFKTFEIKIFDVHFMKVNQTDFFCAIIDYYVQDLKNQDLFKEAPEKFINNVTRKGKRGITPRTCQNEFRTHLYISSINKTLFDNYFNVMFSFIRSTKDIDPTVFSTSYFFYDIIQYTTKNLKQITNFKLDTIN